MPAAAVLLLMMFTRLAPEDRAETEPASSKVAALDTVAMTPDPTVADPTIALNRNVPLSLVAIELTLPSVGGPSISSAPLPALANAAPALLVKVPLNVPLEPPANVAVC